MIVCVGAWYQRIGRTIGSAYSKDGGSWFLQKDGTYVPNYTASHHKSKMATNLTICDLVSVLLGIKHALYQSQKVKLSL
jgi:hypothetical protein